MTEVDDEEVSGFSLDLVQLRGVLVRFVAAVLEPPVTNENNQLRKRGKRKSPFFYQG